VHHRHRVLLLACGALALGASQAQASTGGSAAGSQAQSLAAANDQSGNPNSGSVEIGTPSSVASQTQNTKEVNAQTVGSGGSFEIGNTTQSNNQSADISQNINQTDTGTFVVFNNGLHQIASQVANTLLLNEQSAGKGGGTIVGDVIQTNNQSAVVNQAITQSLTGTFVVLGGTKSTDGLEQAFNHIAQCGICSDTLESEGVGLVGGDMVASGSPNESANGTFVVLGNLIQAAFQDSNNSAYNNQAVSGSFIIGNITQNNNQAAVTNQNITQSLSGTYVVFGQLDQLAGQVANTTLVNKQTGG
jgi:hypothetical protein